MKHLALRSAVLLLIAAGMLLGIFVQKYNGVGNIIKLVVPDENDQRPFISIGNRTKVDLSGIQEKGLMVALVFGQSNAANHGEERYFEVNKNVFNFYEGKLYIAEDPLAGATGSGGSVWTRLGHMLVREGLYDNIIFIPIGITATSMEQWAPEGEMHKYLLDTIGQVQASGLEFTHLFWHHGETDAGILNTGKEEYEKLFLSMLDNIRRAGVKAPIYVSVATRSGRTCRDEDVAGAQRSLVNNRDIRSGPDTDKLGEKYRFDTTHFSAGGLDKFARMWFDILMKEKS